MLHCSCSCCIWINAANILQYEPLIHNRLEPISASAALMAQGQPREPGEGGVRGRLSETKSFASQQRKKKGNHSAAL